MENYALAAHTRLKDWEVLSDAKQKVAAIHMGGIYIECLLKGMICSSHSVVQGNTQGQWNVDGNLYNRPSHALTGGSYSQILTDLYDDMPNDVELALEFITKPKSISYIDYRYKAETEVTDLEYQEWLDQFIILFDYLYNKMQEI